jgi:hypothetical protein
MPKPGNLMKTFSAAALCTLVALSPAVAFTQTANEFAIEATPFHGTISYARGPASGTRLGVDAGFGFPQIDISVAPADHHFTQIMHVGLFGRFNPTRALESDLGVRAGFGDVRDLGADDFPDPYAAATGSLAYGTGRLKFGARITAGYAWPYGDTPLVVAGLTPMVTYSFAW